MSGLPHWNNSTAATQYYEPVFLNQFEVIITPPGVITQNVNLMVEHVLSIDGIPELTPTDLVEQKYKFAKRNYAGGKPSETTMNVSISFTVNLNDANSMYVFKTLRQWSDLIYNPLTGAMGLKKDYTGNILISIFNKQGDVYRRIICKDVFPLKALPEMGLNYTDEGIYTINDMDFAVDNWDDLFL